MLCWTCSKAGMKKNIMSIHGDTLMGITIQAARLFNPSLVPETTILPICLGFDDYERKLAKARQISQYILANIPGKTICAMDLFENGYGLCKNRSDGSPACRYRKGGLILQGK